MAMTEILSASNLMQNQTSEERLVRDFIFLNCEDGNHQMRSVGGCNAGCSKDCACSVPVNECAMCGESDYGDNEDARDVRAECRMLNPPMENSEETGNAWAVPAMTGPLPVAGTPTISTSK